MLQSYVEAIEECLRRSFKDDEVAREALVAAWTTGKAASHMSRTNLGGINKAVMTGVLKIEVR